MKDRLGHILEEGDVFCYLGFVPPKQYTMHLAVWAWAKDKQVHSLVKLPDEAKYWSTESLVLHLKIIGAIEHDQS